MREVIQESVLRGRVLEYGIGEWWWMKGRGTRLEVEGLRGEEGVGARVVGMEGGHLWLRV